ncbi:UNVERIFIED_CONTAM: hypothetical protein Sradi_6956300 [Sesamum radiatum]|uniref:Reverse transcriptase n=1 Tax=Sesamum radiatum TaxID=300843 RepID=A0AAW2JFI6_SESRA
MLDFNSELPKHLVVISPVLRNGKEDPKRIDVEYEWLPQRCKNCCSLGHVSASCPANRIKTVAPPIKVFVKKQSFQLASNKPEQSIRSTEDLRTTAGTGTSGILEEPWLVLGDFNAVIDESEVCGKAADTSASMTEFSNCIRDTELVQLPFTGCPYTWHNCSDGTRSLWKRLDRMLANLAWLEVWPSSAYISALPSTSDHSPLILTGMDRIAERAIFRFDNYLVQLPGFLESVESIWKHRFIGTAMYNVVCKLKNLKAVFRRQQKQTGDLTNNVRRLSVFLIKPRTV